MGIDIRVRRVMLMPLNIPEMELHFNKFLFDGKKLNVITLKILLIDPLKCIWPGHLPIKYK